MKKLFIFGIALLILLPSQGLAAFTRSLGPGSQGEAVRELQRFLGGRGLFTATATGYYGPATREAVRRFQASQGVSPQNGLFGPLTRGRANALLGATGGATTPTSGASLEGQLQALLAQLEALRRQAGATSSPASTPTSTPAATEPVVNAGAIVGINCYFKYLPTGQVFNLGKGSGAIIRPDGLILTARHLVDQQFSYRVDPDSTSANLALNTTLDHCDIGQVPPGTVLPTPDLIRSINPSARVPLLAYRAELAYVPDTSGGSSAEYAALDFALLKITGVSEAGRLFGVTGLPARFDHVTMLAANTLRAGDEVITYGFPGDLPAAQSQSFTSFFLAGGVGKVKDILYGDQRFTSLPVTVNTDMEVRSGRSGSPLFAKGQLAGVITAHALENVKDSYSVSAQAILSFIRQAGFEL